MNGKYCNECKELLPYVAFKHQHNTKDGYSVRCLDCIRKGKVTRVFVEPTETSRVCSCCNIEKHIDEYNAGQYKCRTCIKNDRDLKKQSKSKEPKVEKKPGRSAGVMILENGKVLHQNKNKGWS